jgi:hypothetical protein
MRIALLVLAAALSASCIGERAAALAAPGVVELSAPSATEATSTGAEPVPPARARAPLDGEVGEARSESSSEPTAVAAAGELIARSRPAQRSKLCLGAAPPPRPEPSGCCYVPRSVWQKLLAPAREHAATCQRLAAERGDRQAGRLSVQLEADASGKVALACDSEADDISDPTFVRCVLEGFRALDLPPADDFCPAVRLTYPILFER